MGEFTGKTALVTGAASGIGKAIGTAFAQGGANVVLVDRDATAGESLCKTLADSGGLTTFAALDITDASTFAEVVRDTAAQFGGLDIAVNNAGITGPAKLTADYSDEEWAAVIGVNLTAVFTCMRAEIQAMLEGDGGAIVDIASTAGLRGGKGTAAYSASKHGVLGLTRSAALDYARRGIRINAVCPGAIDTPMLERLTESNTTLRQQIAQRSVMGRHGQPEEIASTVLWLCSDSASFVNGQAIAVDGGSTA